MGRFEAGDLRIALYSALLISGFVAVSLWSFWFAVRPPRLTIPVSPRAYNLRAEEVSIATDDGVKLSGWLIPGSGAPAVILLHGYPAEKADMLPVAAALQPHFATLLVDMRYFGKSEGRATTLGFRERHDLKRTIDFMTERGFRSIGVFGFSLGGAVAIMTAAEDPRIRAVATYAAFSDLKTLGYEIYSPLWVLKYPFVELMILWAWLFLGGDVTTPSPEKAAHTLSIPVLLIHSREDEQISFRHAERLQRALMHTPHSEFYFLERGRHGELPPEFGERLRKFFLTYLHAS